MLSSSKATEKNYPTSWMLMGGNFLTSYCEERVDVYKYCNPKKTKILQGKLIFSNKILRKED